MPKDRVCAIHDDVMEELSCWHADEQEESYFPSFWYGFRNLDDGEDCHDDG